MSVFEISILAQVNAAVEDTTIGQMLSGLLVLFVMAASIAMIIVWFVRHNQTGHALPAARRGLLRVPLPLTAVAIALSLLLFLLTLLVSMEDPIVPPPVAAAQAVSAPNDAPETDLNADESAAATDSDSPKTDEEMSARSVEQAAAPGEAASSDVPSDGNEANPGAAPQPKKLTAGEMKSRLLQVIMMDVMLFLMFGVVVFLASRSGRIHLPVNEAVGAVTAAGNPASLSSNPLWPDLDDASAIPQLPGYSVLGERTNPSPPTVAGTADSFYAPSRDASFDPFAYHHFAGQEPNGRTETSNQPDEPFLFLTELRFAGEVFLAAYVPTAFLRILVVLLTVGLLGEEPGQHPFLEMMNSGVDMTVMALIVLMAVLFAPVVEELQFRVVVLGGIAQMGRPKLALGVSSILFAFAHGFPDSLALLPLAFALGYAYLRRRSYITVMMVHFLFNGFNMTLALLAQF